MPGMQIYKRSLATPVAEKMSTSGLDAELSSRLRELVATQGPDAAETTYLFGGLGMSLSTVWFKSGYPVPLHSHDADCLYYIISGSIRLGSEELHAGDGFVVPASVPYTYEAGPDGVELLEFRTAEDFDIQFSSRQASYWEKLLGKIVERRPHWTGEGRPQRVLSK